MKATELMIGDLVHLYVNNNGITNDNVKVVVLSEDSITVLNKFGIDEEYSEDDVIDGVSAITPILLTEEILKANSLIVGRNVVNEDLIIRCDWFNDHTHPVLWAIHIVSHEPNIFLHCVLDIHTHYVHELQHALRLCGLNDLADNFKLNI